MELIMTDRSGWSKLLKVEKTLTRIGAAATNDIQLKSKGIAPVHLQIIYSTDLPSKCQLVNLAAEIIVHTDEGMYQLPRLSTIEIRNGDEIELGEYRIALKIPLGAEPLLRSSVIDADLSFPDAVIRPDFSTIGHLTIKNIGSKSDCQFRVTLSGLPDDCYQIDPIPLMYPDAQEDVRVQLFHRKHYPPVGFHELRFSITSPGYYPGEVMIIKQGVYVVPVFDQGLELVDDMAASTQPGDEVGIYEPASSPEVLDEFGGEDPVEGAGSSVPEPILIQQVSDGSDVTTADHRVTQHNSDASIDMGEKKKSGLTTLDLEPALAAQPDPPQPELVPEPEVDLADSSSKPLSSKGQRKADQSASQDLTENQDREPQNVKIARKQSDDFWEEE
jgi:hypothetical protein